MSPRPEWEEDESSPIMAQKRLTDYSNRSLSEEHLKNPKVKKEVQGKSAANRVSPDLFWSAAPRDDFKKPKNKSSSNSKVFGGNANNNGSVSVAFLGNSMFYFNDFPRFLEAISKYQISQDSCLHGGASISSLLIEGNGMYPQFQTPSAQIGVYNNSQPIYDYGACTVPQLLVGWDDRLHDPGYAVPEDKNSTTIMNPCREDNDYLEYAIDTYANSRPHWDFIMINDNTRNPARAKTRAHAIQILEQFHVPWFLETSATPVFLWTHAYSINSTEQRNMTGLEDVANFTSLTLVGYKAYVDLLELYLPKSQKPLIAPVGLAFLVVHEENFALWQTMFHCDQIHASPSGTFLQGMVVYYTLMGRLPDKDLVVRDDVQNLWGRARMMQHAWEPANPFPNRTTMEYLYNVAERVMIEGYVPKSFINYKHGEVAYEG